VLCPDCRTRVKTGNGGLQNFLLRHQGTAKCAANSVTRRFKMISEKQRRCVEVVSSTSTHYTTHCCRTSPCEPRPHSSPPSSSAVSGTTRGDKPPPPALSGCPVGVALLRKFRTRIEGLPQDVGEADANHPLAAFAVTLWDVSKRMKMHGKSSMVP